MARPYAPPPQLQMLYDSLIVVMKQHPPPAVQCAALDEIKAMMKDKTSGICGHGSSECYDTWTG
jgi:hypothetical protein